MKKIYVGNLPFTCDDNQLRALFERWGQVVSALVVIDRETGRSRGFGFVEMANDRDTLAAIEALNGQRVEGREIVVNEAKPREAGGGGANRGGSSGRWQASEGGSYSGPAGGPGGFGYSSGSRSGGAFGAPPPRGTDPDSRKRPRSSVDSRPRVDVWIDPGTSTSDELAALLSALADVVRAAGGMGLTLRTAHNGTESEVSAQ